MGKSGADPAQNTPLAVNVTPRQDCVVLHLAGALIRSTALILHERLAQAMVRREPPRLVIDLTQLSALDQHGRALLTSLNERVIEDGGRLALVCTDAATSAAWAGSGMDALPCSSSLEGAVAMVRADIPAGE